MFAIQEEIAEAIGNLLRVHLPKAEVGPSAPNVEAYTRYLRARFLIHQQSPQALRFAIEQLRELTVHFPEYAAAYSGIAAAQGFLCLFGVISGRDAYAEIKANAERGYSIDPASAETCIVLAGLRAWFEYRWNEADKLYERALELQPGYATAHMFRAMGRLCQNDVLAAEAGLRRSMELDPISASDCARMAYLHYVKSDYGTAAEHLRKSFELDSDYAEARLYNGLLHFQQENYDNVIQCLSSSQIPLDIGLTSAAYARKGSESRARKCVDGLRRLAQKQYVTPLAEAFAAAGMGDHDLAFERLAEAIEDQTNFVNMLAVEPFFKPLRNDGRFFRLLKTLNLPS